MPKQERGRACQEQTSKQTQKWHLKRPSVLTQRGWLAVLPDRCSRGSKAE